MEHTLPLNFNHSSKRGKAEKETQLPGKSEQREPGIEQYSEAQYFPTQCHFQIKSQEVLGPED